MNFWQTGRGKQQIHKHKETPGNRTATLGHAYGAAVGPEVEICTVYDRGLHTDALYETVFKWVKNCKKLYCNVHLMVIKIRKALGIREVAFR